MVSLARTIRNFQRVGFREWWRQLQYIGDAKSGQYIGKDEFGNRYFENMNGEEEVPGRHRWVDFKQHDYHASQVPPEWHSWLQHIREQPPTQDTILQQARPAWIGRHVENLTGTRGAYRPYNTAAPKMFAWEPKVAARK
ncbi:NDUFA12-domain-containing protein [Auriculariales sp. MPI-PUGE-AT-0066]|nr:NDUFA12-domain-containing protein [Auriculariales sp. MPI-PUGE-AT-0066]